MGVQIAWNKGKKLSEKSKEKMRISSMLTIDKIKRRYPFFSKIEELCYNSKKEIQTHCRYHKCKNSKEKGGWFTPTYIQLYERIRALEYWEKDINSLYCSQDCKDECPLYRKKETELVNIKVYTNSEYKVFRFLILERDNYKCQYCGEPATDVHHERPQKLEPFFALDPDFAWSCCEKCHYEKGHPKRTECSTKALADSRCFEKRTKNKW